MEFLYRIKYIIICIAELVYYTPAIIGDVFHQMEIGEGGIGASIKKAFD